MRRLQLPWPPKSCAANAAQNCCIMAPVQCAIKLHMGYLCRSYQNELRQRVSANSLKPVNYIEESRLLIAQIEKLAVSA